MTDWVFQWRQADFDLESALENSHETWWRALRYRSQIAVGDRVWLALVGPKNPGVYFIATVTSPVYEGPGDGKDWRTDLRFEYRVDPPMLRPQLVDDPILSSCQALRGFQGTAAPLEAEHANRLGQLCSPRLVPLNGSQPAAAGFEDVDKAIKKHTALVRQELKKQIFELSPPNFEALVVRLLDKLDFATEHVGQTGDGGIDVRAVCSLHGVADVRTQVQAKRWNNIVGARTVRDLRGALKVDERGLLITTSDFSSAARLEAAADGKARITLMNGEELADRCLELGLGVRSRSVVLYEVAAERLLHDSDSFGTQVD